MFYSCTPSSLSLLPFRILSFIEFIITSHLTSPHLTTPHLISPRLSGHPMSTGISELVLEHQYVNAESGITGVADRSF